MAFNQFHLPNGGVLKNRIVKAAMEEQMTDSKLNYQPSPSMIKLYEAWGKGGAGLIMSGHIVVDPWATAAPGDTILAEDFGLNDDIWKKWTKVTKQDGAQFFFQINHPGRQMKKQEGVQTYGPSDKAVDIGRMSNMFGTPKAMSEKQIQKTIDRFVFAARKAEEFGADGVEIHAAHGYLLSQFLSPLTNIRTDRWGGSLENRARLLFEIVKAIRATVASTFGVGIKINSSDFQRGGFGQDDLHWIVQQLNTMQIDFIELSGGNYESPAMAGPKNLEGGNTEKPAEKPTSTALRESYFIQAAEELVKIANMPVIVTGGIRKRATLEGVIATSDRLLAGTGSALGLIPDLPNRWQRGEDPAPNTSKSSILPKNMAGLGHISAVRWNMRATGGSGRTWFGVWPVLALIDDMWRESRESSAYLKWLKTKKNPMEDLA